MIARRRSAAITIAVLVGVTLGAWLAGAPSAGAHASFVASDPADGAVLPEPPADVTVRFNEPPDPAISQIRVVDAAGRAVGLGRLELVDRTGLRAPFTEELADGAYTVTWFAVSTVDGHLTTNAFAFGVGDTDVATSDAVPSTPGPDALGVAGRMALYAGLALVVALAVVGGWAFDGRLRAIRVVAVGAAIAAAAGAALLVASEVALIGASARAFLASDTGRSFVALLIAVAATAALAILAAARTNRVTLSLAGVAAIAAWAARAAAGHPDGVSQTVGQTVHTTAVGVWIGGLVLLALLLRERRGASPPASEVRRFSTLALVSVILVLLTGSVRAVQEIGGVGAVADALDTSYGQVLALKVALALGLVVAGTVNRRRSIPRAAAGEPCLLGRVVRAEVVVAVGIALLTGTLTSLPPGGLEASAGSAPEAIRDEASDFGTTVRVELTAAPGTPGPNTFEVQVADYDDASPVAPDAVTLRFARVGAGAGAPDGSLDLARRDDRWAADGSAISIAGTWNVTAQVRTGAETLDVPLVLTTRVPGATTSVAEVAGQPSITTLTYRDGASAQLYVDPGTTGPNQVHLTAFDPAGQELPLDDATLAVVPPDGPARAVDVLRFGQGHFVANVDLEEGPWTFDFTAVPVDGAPVQATLSTTIGDGT